MVPILYIEKLAFDECMISMTVTIKLECIQLNAIVKLVEKRTGADWSCESCDMAKGLWLSEIWHNQLSWMLVGE